MKRKSNCTGISARIESEALKRIVRNVFTLAVECGSLSQEEMDSVSSRTLSGINRKTLERLSHVATWAASVLAAEAVHR